MHELTPTFETQQQVYFGGLLTKINDAQTQQEVNHVLANYNNPKATDLGEVISLTSEQTDQLFAAARKKTAEFAQKYLDGLLVLINNAQTQQEVHHVLANYKDPQATDLGEVVGLTSEQTNQLFNAVQKKSNALAQTI